MYLGMDTTQTSLPTRRTPGAPSARIRRRAVRSALAAATVTAVLLPTGIGAGAGASTPAPTVRRAATPTVLFDDEFNASSLDLAKWRPNWLGSSNTAITPPINGAEKSCYDPKQVSLAYGALVLTAAARSCTANGHTYSYASGLVESAGHFSFTYGRLVARVYLSGTTSIANWPAVWTDGSGSWPSTGESDIMEGLGGQACWHYHSPSGGPGACVSTIKPGWHTFAERVRPGTTTYYYDGVQVGSTANVGAPHYIILNLGVGGYGGPIATGAPMFVDYIRVTT